MSSSPHTPQAAKHPPVGESVLIDVQGVHKSFGKNHVIRGVDLQVHEGEVLAIIGISGCGKSTLLRLISGLERADAGQIQLADSNYSFVFQYSALFDSLTIFENVAFSLLEEPDGEEEAANFVRLPEEEIRSIVCEKLKMVGLEGIEDLYPNQLSGGMQKRVSFARAIVDNPRIILYDEPTAGLDPIASRVLEDYILKLRDELGAASVVVTHQHSTIHRTADRICLLHHGQIVWQGSPEALENSDDPFAQQFARAELDGPLTDEAH
jgi:phospholipid/cholesterol/gamma-HCH transport system ATP-binding protein